MFELAKKGAEARVRELVGELRMLTSTFPHLRDAFDRDELPIAFLVAEKSGRLKQAARTGARTRRPVSAAARKRISNAQKRRWAKQKRQSKST